MEPDRVEDIFIPDAVFGLGKDRSGLGVKERAAVSLIFGDLQPCLVTDLDHLAQVHTFGTVVQKSRRFSFIDISPIAHGQRSRRTGYIHGMDKAAVREFGFEFPDQINAFLLVQMSAPLPRE